MRPQCRGPGSNPSARFVHSVYACARARVCVCSAIIPISLPNAPLMHFVLHAASWPLSRPYDTLSSLSRSLPLSLFLSSVTLLSRVPSATPSFAAFSSFPRSTISQDWRNWLICIVPSVCLSPIMRAMDHSRAIQKACGSKRVVFDTYVSSTGKRWLARVRDFKRRIDGIEIPQSTRARNLFLKVSIEDNSMIFLPRCDEPRERQKVGRKNWVV